MIVVLEGINGTGKTTVANLLKGLTTLVLYKPFEDVKRPNKVTGERDYGDLQRWGVSVNTFWEDLVVADLVSKTSPGIILDRSLPSAIAYDCAGDSSNYKSMIKWWEERIKQGSRGKLVYVQLDVAYEVAKSRCVGDVRWCPNKKDYTAIQKRFDKVWKMITIPKIKIDTKQGDPRHTVDRILRMLGV